MGSSTSMASTRKNALRVVEGEREEPKLVNALFGAFNPEADWVVYEYRTVVHELIDVIVGKYDGDYENLEVCRVLAEEAYAKNEVEQAERLLYTKYTDVILMFDFDPQDDRFNPIEMKKMMAAFCDSTDTDRGLLLIRPFGTVPSGRGGEKQRPDRREPSQMVGLWPLSTCRCRPPTRPAPPCRGRRCRRCGCAPGRSRAPRGRSRRPSPRSAPAHAPRCRPGRTPSARRTP